jgi:hypothetical protein
MASLRANPQSSFRYRLTCSQGLRLLLHPVPDKKIKIYKLSQ